MIGGMRPRTATAWPSAGAGAAAADARSFERFYWRAAQAQHLHSRRSMASVKLGRKTFDVNSEVIDADFCSVTAADCAALAARMKTGEISRVKRLILVRFISVLFLLCFIFCALLNRSFFAGQQQHRPRRRSLHRRRFADQQQRGDAVACALGAIC